jgi:hypothetical protein
MGVMWVRLARSALAAIAAGSECPASATIATEALARLDLRTVPPPEPDLPPAEGEPAELLARLVAGGGHLFEDLTEQRGMPMYHIWHRQTGHLYISLAALRYALPQWEALRVALIAQTVACPTCGQARRMSL